jgi:protoporphyrinogen oxidase
MRRSKKNISNYKEAIIRAVGDRIYDVFYKDFAIKLWGLPPENIAVDGARRRKTFLNLSSITKSLFGGYKYFFYPKNGIGDIANKLEKDIVCSGANIIKDAMTESVELKGGKVSKLLVKELSGKTMEIDAEVIVSTIPVDSLFALLRFQKNAAYSLKWRGLRLVYLYINHALRHDNDTFYFPNLDIIFGRVSNISKFSPFIKTGSGNTLLTLEIPCSPGDKCWEMPEEELVELCCRDLTRIGLIVKETRIIKHFSKRIEKAYPLYDIGWKNNFQRIYNELKNIGGLFIAGRQGLFLHCNIDHCIIQGLELSDFIISKAKNNASTVWDSRIEKFMSFSARD